tara:strand:+ start:366 stop:566 length:201 start_codon:yes stop_codon:yes gene_type:complete
MYLAIILYCSVVTDVNSCDVLIRQHHLFETEQECTEQVVNVGKGLIATGHYVKGSCFEFNPFGESV